MDKLASDIVLLPSEEITKAAIRLNQSLLQRFEKKIILSRNDSLPHLSLAMGALRAEEIPAVADRLEEVASAFPPINLNFTGIQSGPTDANKIVSTWEVKRTAELQALHETIMNRMSLLLTPDATAEHFIGFPNIGATSVAWVNRFRNTAAFERFSPHITLGVGTFEPDTSFPQRGIAPRLALCHLGDHCTCRKILFETPLRGPIRKRPPQ